MANINPNHVSHLSLREAGEIYASAFTGLVRQVGKTLATWQERHNARQQLQMMDERLLNDIGMDHNDALHEANKPFWRA